MTKKILPTPEELRQLLRYEPETGKLYWKERPLSMFSSSRIGNAWNAKHVGKEALIVDNNGYRKGRIFGVEFMAHRVAWAVVTGQWPSGHIDHADGDRSNNRISNLRDSTRSQNLSNRGAQNNNSSGYKGVHWCKQKCKWVAKIMVSGKAIYLGVYACPNLAHAAYCEAAKKHHGEFARTE